MPWPEDMNLFRIKFSDYGLFLFIVIGRPSVVHKLFGLKIFIHIIIYIVIYKYTVYNTIMMGFRKKSNDLYKSVSL